MTADTITAIKKALEDLDALVAIVAKDTGALIMSDPDEDSVEPTLEGDLEMTFGHVRRAHRALSTLESLQRENEESKARIEKLEQTLKSVTGNKIGFTYEPTGERVNLYSPNSSAFAIIAQHPEILQAIVGARADIEGRAALSSTGDTHGN